MSERNWDYNIPEHWTREHVQAEIELMNLHMKWFEQLNDACERCHVECGAQLPTAERSALDHQFQLFLDRANELDLKFPGLIAQMQAGIFSPTSAATWSQHSGWMRTESRSSTTGLNAVFSTYRA